MDKPLNLNIEILRYLIVGGLNVILTGVIFYLLLYMLKQHYLIALGISWILGIIFTYVLNFIWVFQPEKKLRFQERFLKYFFIYFTSFASNVLVLYFFVEYMHFDPWWVQLFLIPFIVVFNFLLTKFWSLKRLN